ncbi:FG-GAP-like repeat-containing protein, partial [Paracoccaceae bacterium]|nr:FG-GAP-like repeat-containing protein [Paracoccaceae bacterium]
MVHRVVEFSGNSDYAQVNWEDVGFVAPSPDSLVTQALETYYNDETQQSVTVLTGGYTAPAGWIKGETLTDIKDFYGSELDETIIGNDLDNHIYGSGGNNFLTGGSGEDVYHVTGNDMITDLTTGDALIVSEGAIANTREIVSFAATTDTVNDGTVVITTSRNEASQIDLSLASAGIYTIAGGFGADILIGSPGVDTIVGGGGHDIIKGGAGNDNIWGMEGDDTLIYEGSGSDQINAGSGHDTLRISNIILWSEYRDVDDLLALSENGVDTVRIKDAYSTNDGLEIIQYGFDDGSTSTRLVSKNDTVPVGGDHFFAGTEYSDTIDGSMAGSISATGYLGDDTIVGSTGIDFLGGGKGQDVISGGDGSDVLRGGEDNDIIKGGDGDDFLYGDDGNDLIESQGGIDNIWGGAGSDSFDTQTANWDGDTIHDLEQGEFLIVSNGSVAVSLEDISIMQTGHDTVTDQYTYEMQVVNGANDVTATLHATDGPLGFSISEHTGDHNGSIFHEWHVRTSNDWSNFDPKVNFDQHLSTSTSLPLYRSFSLMGEDERYGELAAPDILAVGDLNNDGRDDIVLDYFESAIPPVIMLGNIDGTFDRLEYDIGNTTRRAIRNAELADVNNDGFLDFIGFCTGQAGWRWEEKGFDTLGTNIPRGEADLLLINEGGLGFSALDLPQVSLSDWNHGGTAGDIDGDGFIDILTLREGEREWTAPIKNIDGQNFDMGTTEYSEEISFYGTSDIDAADLNGDGHLDMVFVIQNSTSPTIGSAATLKTLRVLMGDGDFDFSDNHIFSLGESWIDEDSEETILDNFAGQAVPGSPWVNIEELVVGSGAVDLIDIDLDGDLDILEAQYYSVSGLWKSAGFKYYENQGFMETSEAIGTHVNVPNFVDKTDIVFPNQTSNRHLIEDNAPGFIRNFHFADLNYDDLPDLVLQPQFDGDVFNYDFYPYIFFNLGNGTFLPKPTQINNDMDFKKSDNLHQLVTGDFNGDGQADLAGVKYSYGETIDLLSILSPKSAQDPPSPTGPSPFRVEEVSRDGDVVTFGIFVDGAEVPKLYDGLDGNGVEETAGVASISTKLGYTPEDFVPLIDGGGNHLDDFKFTTALSTAEIFAMVAPPVGTGTMTMEEAMAFAATYENNAHWAGGKTEGIVGSPQVLEGTWNLSGSANNIAGAYDDADTDFQDPWMTFSGTLAANVETVTFTLFEAEMD